MKYQLFISGVALALMVGTSSAEELAGMDVDRGYQRPGSDYAHYHVKNAKHCARDCYEDNRCRAFDFNKNDHTCWLKDRVPAKTRNSEINTGGKPGHHYDYGYGSSGKQVAKAPGYCVMRNRETGRVNWERSCHIKQSVSNNKNVFVIKVDNGRKYKFVQRDGEDWTIQMDQGYSEHARFKDKGKEGVFKWDNHELLVWEEGR